MYLRNEDKVSRYARDFFFGHI